MMMMTIATMPHGVSDCYDTAPTLWRTELSMMTMMVAIDDGSDGYDVGGDDVSSLSGTDRSMLMAMLVAVLPYRVCT